MNYYSDNYLMHHGVKGMKWGVRKRQYKDGSLTPAGQRRYAVENARNDLRSAKTAERNARRSRNTALYGPTYARKNAAYTKARLNTIDKRANLARAKAKSKSKADAAELRAYAKAMKKTGLRGSAYDTSSGGQSTELYNHLVATKGRKYANTVEKKVSNQLTADIAVGVVAMGAGLALQYYSIRNIQG